MTELSTSAREAECTCENPTMTPVGRCHNCYLPIAGYQARDSEGKGEAWAWPEFDEKAANAEIDRMSNDDSYRGRRWDLLSVMRWQHESLRKIMKAPPAPKDERVEKLIAAVKKYLNQAPVDGWHFTDCDSADDNYDEGLPCSCGVGVSEAELREALRAFKGGENG